MNLNRRLWRFLLLAAGGILTGLCLVFPEVGFFEWLTLVPAGMVILTLLSDPTVRLRRLYGYGLFYFLCFYLTVFHWFISMYPLEFTGITKGAALVVVFFAWIGLSLFQALMGGLTFVVGGILLRNRLAERYPLLRPFLFALCYTVYEWTQNLGWWGVPWGRLPLGQTKYAVGLQSAALFGSYFVTFLLVAVNLCLAYAVCMALSGEGKPMRERISRGAVIAVTVMLLFQYGAGTLIWLGRGKSDAENTVKVAAVQGNISSKWNNSDADRLCREVYTKYTLEAAAAGAEIVVWPETAVTYTIWESDASRGYRFCSDLAKESGVTLLVGGFSMKDEGQYNSIFCFLPDGSLHETIYDKRKLVPFGEFVPFGSLIETLVPPLAELVMSGTDLEEGTEANVFALEQGEIGSLICFDSIYDSLTRDSVLAGAELLCLSTNDSWFGSSRALNMHRSQAALRAVESGRWILRSANTGITCVINDRGEVVEEIPILSEGVLVTEVTLREEIGFYTRTGNLLVWCGIVGIVALCGWEFSVEIRRRIFRKSLDNSEKK